MNGSIADRVMEAVKEQAKRIDQAPYADVIIHVQDGNPVMVEINSKHKIRGANHITYADFGLDGTFRGHKPTV